LVANLLLESDDPLIGSCELYDWEDERPPHPVLCSPAAIPFIVDASA